VIWFSSLVNLVLFLILLGSVYKKPSLLVFALVTTVVVFLIRPFAVLLHGSTILTESFYSDINYENGLLIGTAFYLVFYVAVILCYHKKSSAANPKKLDFVDVRIPSIFLTAVMCVVFLALFLFIGGIDVLFVNRTASISVVAPSLRYVYPFAIVFLCIGSMQGAIMLAQKRILLGGMLLVLYLFASMILAQRGFFILFVVVGVALSLRGGKVSLRSYISMLLPFFFVLLLAVSSKQLLETFFGSGNLHASAQHLSPSEEILSSPDGDASEVWMLAAKFTSDNGYLFGGSVINNIFNIFSHNQRREWGLMNGSDVMNNTFTGEGYWDLGFGFNVTLPIELYINFGLFGLIPICFFGILLGSSLRQFDDRVSRQGRDPSWEVLRLYAVYTLCTSLAGLQWSILFFVVYSVTRLRWSGTSSKSMVNSS
tara:strand:- start:88 stop:1365 length:1278 start_codon:yes stop_codon:yes gene_type:complete